MLGELNAFSKICAVSLKVLTIYSVFFFFFKECTSHFSRNSFFISKLVFFIFL